MTDYQDKMRAKNCSTHHVRTTLRYIREIAQASGWRTVSQIESTGVVSYAARLRDKGRSARTVQAHITAIKSFTKWLASTQKIHRDPLTTVERPNPKADPRQERRMVMPDEWPWLLRGIEELGDSFGMTIAERKVLYDLAIQTGLRAGEIRQLLALPYP